MDATAAEPPARRSLRGLAAILFMAAAIAGAPAQADEPTFEAATTPLRCLVAPARETLKYPRGQAERKGGGVIRVRLTFTAAGQEPRAEVFFDTVGDVFRDAVLDYVSAYRLPCLAPGAAPLVATQEFEFDPGDGRKVIWYGARDAVPPRSKFKSCITGADKVPDYPSSALRANEEGFILARYTFVDATSPPKVQIVYDGGSHRLARVVEGYADGFRLPCLGADEAPLTAQQSFRFSIQGNRKSSLKDASLPAFAGALDKLESQHVRFDFNTMGCPFELRFVLLQPYFDNSVGELERRDPNRREFIEWLKRVDFKLSDKDRHQVIGDSMTISVPCTILDLL